MSAAVREANGVLIWRRLGNGKLIKVFKSKLLILAALIV
jgi:hypothetical protein